MQASHLKPLNGMRILITRPKHQAEAFSEKLRALGATTIELPTIEIAHPTDTRQLDDAVQRLKDYRWIVFTSVHGAQFFLGRFAALGVPLSALEGVRIAAIGPATANALNEAGVRPDHVPGEFLSEKIVLGLGDVHGQRILLPRADIASRKLPDLLRKRGALVDDVVAYRTLIPGDLTPETVKAIFEHGVDVVTFTSPSTITNLAQVLGGEELKKLLQRTRVACIGPVTLEAAKGLGIDAEVVAMTHTIDALVEAIVSEIGTV
jgi:uroporphyrinogen III methyltransferase/synthase